MSALTLLRKKGTPSIAEKGRTLGDCGRKKRGRSLKMELNKPIYNKLAATRIVYEVRTVTVVYSRYVTIKAC